MYAHSLQLVADTSVQIAAKRVNDSWAWYVIRASGLVSISLLVLLMISGIGHVTGWTYRFIAPVKAWAAHKAMAILLAFSIAVHIGLLLVDHYVRFSVTQILVPFTMLYSNKTTVFGVGFQWIAIPAGILAAYGSYIVIASSLDTVGWINQHKRLWKLVHFISYLVIVLALIHALSAGTDFKETQWRVLIFVTLGLLLLATVMRFARRNRKPSE